LPNPKREFPPTVCVVTTVKVPQELPLHPGPLNAQLNASIGVRAGNGR